MILLFIVVIMYTEKYSTAKPWNENDESSISQSPQNEVDSQLYPFPFVTRSEWGARIPKDRSHLATPVPYLVIHHSYTPMACYTRQECDKAMRAMQNFHMDDRGWWDVGYNFAVGSDGAVYEGRGWETLGAHAKGFNTVSIGICLIGDWTKTSPPPEQLKSTETLITSGVKLGYIQPEYKLVGHRQVRDTECPGDALYDVIKTWKHYSPYSAIDEKVVLLTQGKSQHFVLWTIPDTYSVLR